MIEVYKLLPIILRVYEFEFAEPDNDWNVWHGWFQHQRDVNVRVKRRDVVN